MNAGDKVTFRRNGKAVTGTFKFYAKNGTDLAVSIAKRAHGPGRLMGLTTVIVKPSEVIDPA